MRISEEQGQGAISIDRRDADGGARFDVAASIDGFAGRNPRITPSGVGRFHVELGDFESLKRSDVTLEGTEPFRLSIARIDGAGHLWITVRLARRRPSKGSRNATLSFEAGFPFDAEFSGALVAGLRALLKGQG